MPEAEGDVDLNNDKVAGVATTVMAQPVSLYDLNVPNPITSGFDAGQTFDVSAVDIDGYIGGTQSVTDAGGNPIIDSKTGDAYTVSQPNYYTFQGQEGQLMSFQAMSASVTFIKDPVDTTLTIYGPNGQVVAFNDDQFEPSDSSIFDLTLPLTGTYTVEVGAFHSTDPSFNDPSAQNYLPAAFYNAQHGAYELFMYTFSAYNANPGSDSIQYTSSSQSLTSTPQVTTSTGVVPGTSYGAIIVFGTGANLLVGAGESSSEGGSSFALQPTSTVTLTAPGGTYTGSPIAATALVGTQSIAPSTSLDGVAPTLTYYVVSGDSFTELGTTAPTNVGSYIVVASFPGNANYAPSSATASFTITPATLTITATVESKVYDGTTSESAAPTFQVAGEPVDTLYGSNTITGLTEAFTSKDVLGADLSTLVVTGYVINDDDDGANYRVTLLSALGTITPAALNDLRDEPDQGLRRHGGLDGRTDRFRAVHHGRRHDYGPEPGVRVQERAWDQWQHAAGHRLCGQRWRRRQGLHRHPAHRQRHDHAGGAVDHCERPDQGLRRHDGLGGRTELFRADHRRR